MPKASLTDENPPAYIDNGVQLLRVVGVHASPPAMLLVEDVKYPDMPLAWVEAKDLAREGFKPTRRKGRTKRTKS